jgi:arylsulfatase A-like enzyme
VPRPNIVLILADDLGFGDLGCYGQKRIATPNIDRLASEGMLFRSYYAGSCVCAPSRCCLLTGMHTGHARVRDNLPHGVALQPDDVAIAGKLPAASAFKNGERVASSHGGPALRTSR